MQAHKSYRMAFALLCVLSSCLLAACDSGPRTLDDCLLKASRESQNDRQFRSMAEGCKQQFRSR